MEWQSVKKLREKIENEVLYRMISLSEFSTVYFIFLYKEI